VRLLPSTSVLPSSALRPPVRMNSNSIHRHPCPRTIRMARVTERARSPKYNIIVWISMTYLCLAYDLDRRLRPLDSGRSGDIVLNLAQTYLEATMDRHKLACTCDYNRPPDCNNPYSVKTHTIVHFPKRMRTANTTEFK